jgi:hypothetical protein
LEQDKLDPIEAERNDIRKGDDDYDELDSLDATPQSLQVTQRSRNHHERENELANSITRRK